MNPSKNTFVILKGKITLFKKCKKNRRKPKTTSFPIRKYSTPPGPWAKSDKEKSELFSVHLSEDLSPRNNNQGQEVEQDLATPTQSQERITAFTSKEIKGEIKMLNQKKGTRSGPYYCQNANRTTKRWIYKPNVYIQRQTTNRILA